MKTTEELVEILNDLVQINNDRIAGYQRAMEDARTIDADLQLLFSRMKSESMEYVEQLRKQIVQLGGTPDRGTTLSGKIYRAWMDVKTTFSGGDRASLLSSCEFGEDAAQKAYEAALEEDLPLNISSFIHEQKAALKKSHDEIKALRDVEKTVY
jgi:uncharacterized protein (TIGR02284 family)